MRLPPLLLLLGLLTGLIGVGCGGQSVPLPADGHAAEPANTSPPPDTSNSSGSLDAQSPPPPDEPPADEEPDTGSTSPAAPPPAGPQGSDANGGAPPQDDSSDDEPTTGAPAVEDPPSGNSASDDPDVGEDPPPPPPPAPPPPAAVTGMSPADGVDRVKTPVYLAWSAAAGSESYDVFWGTDESAVRSATRSSPEFRGSVVGTIFNAGALSPGTVIFWRVDAVNAGGATPGAVLSFRTRPPPLLSPVISAEYQVTESGQTVGNAPNPECTNMARVGDGLFVIYRTAIPSGLWVRRFDLNSLTFGSAVAVDTVTDSAFGGYHSEPSLLHDQAGRLHVFNQYAPMIGSCTGQPGIAPRWRTLGDLHDSTTWSAPGCFPSRVINSQSAQFYDIMGVFDGRSGVTHVAGQVYGLVGLDGAGNYGFPRCYYRIRPDGSIDGPYILVETISEHYAKGDLALGKEPHGRRSLHVLWSIRRLFNDSSGQHQWNWNLYHAVSRDGGDTWSPVSGGATRSLTEHILFNDSRFLAYHGDVGQNSERSFDVDSEGRPVIVYLRHRPGTGVSYQGLVDVQASPAPQYDLAWQRWTGTQWVGGIVNNAIDWVNTRPKVRVDADDNIWVFVYDQPLYFVSRDGGATWSPPTLFATGSSNSRLYSLADPVDPNIHYIAYTSRHTWRMFLIRMQLTNP